MSEPKLPILVVDDEESVHRALDRALRREPYELLHASGAGEAQAILNQRADLRAVLCDHDIPRLPGLGFLLHLRRTRPKVIAVLFTAQAHVQTAQTAVDQGRLHRFFTKPWDGVELRVALRKLLRLAPEDPGALPSQVANDPERLGPTKAPSRDATGARVIGAPEGWMS